MTIRRSDVFAWLLAGSLLAASPALAQKKTNKPLSPEQQAAREKFDPQAQQSSFGGSVVEQRVAQVNDQIITTSDYDRAEAQLEQEGQQQGWSPQELENRKRDLLRDLIDQQLLLSKGKDLGITGDNELVRRLDEIRKQNHLDTMEDLEKAASSQGVSFEDFKQTQRNSIITQQVIREQVGRKLQMTQSQLRQYYQEHLNEFTQPESVKLSEILIPTTGDDPAKLAAAKAKADELEAQLKAGADFAQLAKANSGGSTAAQGGDLGDFKRGALAKQLEDATFALQAGQSTEPIRTRQGYVILKVTQHTPGGVQSFESVMPQVEEAAFMGRMQPALRDYLGQLRENAYIDVRPGYVDSAAARNPVKPLYSAYAPPAPKKKPHFTRTRYSGAQRGRHAGATADTSTTAAPAAGAKTANDATAAPGDTTKTANGTTVALGGSVPPATARPERPGKKEKIRFGQAPREALPPASTDKSPDAAAPADAAAEQAQVASASSSANTDVPDASAAPATDRKTRFADRPRVPKSKRPKTADQVENERTDKPTAEEAAAQKTQSAPLGLAGDTAKKKKAPRVKGDKTRYSDEAGKPKEEPAPAPQSSTPSPLATPGTVPTSNPPADATPPAQGTQPQP